MSICYLFFGEDNSEKPFTTDSLSTKQRQIQGCPGIWNYWVEGIFYFYSTEIYLWAFNFCSVEQGEHLRGNKHMCMSAPKGGSPCTGDIITLVVLDQVLRRLHWSLLFSCHFSLSPQVRAEIGWVSLNPKDLIGSEMQEPIARWA